MNARAIPILVLALGFVAALGCNEGSGAHPDGGAPPTAPAASAAFVAPSIDTRSDAGAPAARLVLKAARALAPRSGAVVAPAFVDIRGALIASVTATAPADAADVVDLGNATLVPGFIDAHTHLLTNEKPEDPYSMPEEVVTMSVAERALRGVAYGRSLLDAGFTTVRDLGNSGHGGDVALKRAIARGWVEGPAMVVSGRALAPPGGQFPPLTPPFQSIVDAEYAVVRGPDDARAQVRQTLAEGVDCIKVIVDQDRRALREPELRAIVEEAHASGVKVAAHVLAPESAAAAVAAGVDSLEHGYDLTDATIDAMARKKIFLVPTDYPMAYYERFVPSDPAKHAAAEASMRKFHDGSQARLKRAYAKHVRIAAGSDAYDTAPGSDRGKEASQIFLAYAEAGMAPLDVLRATTSEAADLLGLPASFTAMTSGAAADLVALDGDPRTDVTALLRVRAVVKSGRLRRR